MKQIIIDCAAIHDRAELHDALKEALELPEWYGRNLDALHDCLTELTEETELTLKNWQLLDDILGPYAARFVFVCHRASEENPRFSMVMET